MTAWGVVEWVGTRTTPNIVSVGPFTWKQARAWIREQNDKTRRFEPAALIESTEAAEKEYEDPEDVLMEMEERRVQEYEGRFPKESGPEPEKGIWMPLDLNAADPIAEARERIAEHFKSQEMTATQRAVAMQAGEVPTDGYGTPLTQNDKGEWVNEGGDTPCPNDGEMTNLKCWKCGWLR